jgi:glutamine phosphoribosylpyrophosphate amidotransferase
MKKISLLLMAIMFMNSAKSQNVTFDSAMKQAINSFKELKTVDDLNIAIQSFSNIAEKNSAEWLPNYYAAYLQARFAINRKGNISNLADSANMFFERVEKLIINSETECLKAMVAFAKMRANSSQTESFLQEAMMAIEQARKLDSLNPRTYLIEAEAMFNVPEEYGGGCAVAKSLAQKGLSLFNVYKTKSTIHPAWGKANGEAILNRCK